MYQTLLSDANLFRFLLKLDQYLATAVKEEGCRCGGKLHRASYPRKPRGVPAELDEAYSSRHSYCCAKEGCRKRATPASFRFLGRRVFAGAVVVLVAALRHGATPVRVAKLREMVGVSRRTIERWRMWWLADFIRSPFWKGLRARFVSPLDKKALPLSLLEAFAAEREKDKLVALLRLILPLTTVPWLHAL